MYKKVGEQGFGFSIKYGTGPPDCLKKSLFDNFDIFSARAVLILILKLFFHLLTLFCFVS